MKQLTLCLFFLAFGYTEAQDNPPRFVLDASRAEYFGGSGFDTINAVAVDMNGDVYITGTTNSLDLPVSPAAFQQKYPGSLQAGFVAKFDPAGNLIYSTYLGAGATPCAITVDASGHAYVAGAAGAGFPVTPDAFRTKLAAGTFVTSDAFVTKLSPGGDSLLYSTYLGQSNGGARGIYVDYEGNAYVAGFTIPSFSSRHGFVAKLNDGGSALLYSLEIAGNRDDVAEGIAVNSAGLVYVTGRTSSTNLPTTPSALLKSYAGGAFDAFLCTIAPDGSRFEYFTYLGTSSGDWGMAVSVDNFDNVYVAGFTGGAWNFPANVAGQSKRIGPIGYENAFLVKFDSMHTIVYSVVIGGRGQNNRAFAVAPDGTGGAYIAGFTDSPDFPLTSDASQTNFGTCVGVGGCVHGFVTRLDNSGSLAYSSFLGGSGMDMASGVAVTATGGTVYVVGNTKSDDFMNARGAYGGGQDGFIVQISQDKPILRAVTNAASNVSGKVVPGSIATLWGLGFTHNDPEISQTNPLPTASCGKRTQVLFTGSDRRTLLAPFFYCSQLQLNVQVPKDLRGPTAWVQVQLGETLSNQVEVQVVDADPSIFLIDPVNKVGAVIFADGPKAGQLVTRDNPAKPNDFLSVFATGLGETMPPLPGDGIATPPPISLPPSPERPAAAFGLYTTLRPVTASANNIPWKVLFSGLAPGFVGLYQVNVQVPEGFPTGVYPFALMMEGSERRVSNEILLAVQN